jgi:hypothetical protein
MTSGVNKLDVGVGTLSVQNIDFISGTAGGSGHQVSISSGTATVSGNVTGSGTSGSIVFLGAGLMQIKGAFYTSSQGTLTPFTGSTVEYNGANQTVQSFTYNSLLISGTGTKSLAGTTTTNENLTIADNTALTIGGVALTVKKLTTIGGGSSGSISITSNMGTKTFIGLVTLNSGATWSNTNSPVAFRGGITNAGTFTAGTGVHTFNTNSQVLNGTFVIPSVTVAGAAVSLTNTNALTIGTALSGTGTLVQGGNSVLTLGGTSAITNLNASAAGNTVTYSGTNQTVHGNSYQILDFSGSGTKTLQAGTTVIGGNLTLSGTVSTTGVAGLAIGGTVTIGAGTTFTSGAFTHQVAGDFINNGNFVSTGGAINFNGAVQTVTGVVNFNDLQINSTTSFTAPSGSMGVSGTFTNNSPSFVHNGGTVNFNGGSLQNITGSSATTFNNINVTNVGGVVSVESNQNLMGVLTLSGGATFDADGSSNTSVFTLLSLNDSPAQDASIATLPAGANVNGSVTVQRYMSAEPAPAAPLTTYPLGVQGIYRYIASPVTTATVSQWQSSFSITGNFTGKSTPDPSTGTNTVCGVVINPSSPSMFYWNEPTNKYVAYPTTNSSAPLVNGKGYSAFVRNCSTPTIIQVRGPIYNASTIPFDFSPQLSYTGATSNTGVILVGNPFPSSIDWGATTGWTKTGISPVVAITDNGGTGNGTLRYLDATNGTGQFIASGQAFWVRATASGATLKATEAVKSSGGSFQFYRQINPSNDHIEISITNGLLSDNANYKLNSNSQPALDDFDGPKLDNARLNLSTISSDKIKMAINSTNQLACGSAILMDISIPGIDPQTNQAFSIMPDGNYKLNFSMNGQFKSYVLILHDAYTHTNQNLSQNPTYTFVASVDKPGSNLANRFSIRLSDALITLDNSVDSGLKVCGSEQAIIELKNSSSDLRYFASIQDQAVSDTLTGSGSTLRFAISSNKLEAGMNTIVFKAVGKCNTYTLDHVSLVTHDALYLAKSPSVTKCGSGSVTLSATGAPSKGSYYWYTKANGATPVFVGNSFETPSLNKNETYYVAAVNELGCVGERIAVNANIVDLQPASIQVQSDLITLQSNYTEGNQWFLDGVLVPGAIDQNLIPTKSGAYTVKVSRQDCSVDSAPLIFVMMGEASANDLNLKFYPNPTDGIVTFEVKLQSQTVASVIDNLGRTVGKMDFTYLQDGFYQGKYDFGVHASGVYFVRIPDGSKASQLIKIIRK